MKRRSNMLIVCILLLLGACTGKEQVTIDRKNDAALSHQPATEKTLVTLKSGVVTARSGNDYSWQGDLLLSPVQFKALDETGSIFSGVSRELVPEKTLQPMYNMPLQTTTDPTKAVGVYPTPYNLWAMVRYTLAADLTPDRKSIVDAAITHWQANTNVRFYNATGKPTKDPFYGFDYPYIEFVNSNVNSSYVGRIGGRQVVNLAAYQDSRVAIHEIGHAIGLFHEHNRYDRDNYVSLNLNNVAPADRYNFDKITGNYSAIGPMDFSSVMLYGSYTFSNNGGVVMTKKDGTTFSGSAALSDLDKRWANTYYLPYKARYDTYRELDDIVYKSDNTIMTPQERLDLQAQLNNGNPNPPYSPPIESTPIYLYYNQDARDFATSSVYYPNGMWDGNWKFKFILGYGAGDTYSLPNAAPVYRYYNEHMIDNYYSTWDLGSSISGFPEWKRTDITSWAFSVGGYGRIPVYCYLSPNNGHHAVSTDIGPAGNLSNGEPYTRVNIIYYVYPNPAN